MPIESRPQKLSYLDAWSEVLKKVFSMGFKISSTQPLTTANGNCMFAACGDQMVFESFGMFKCPHHGQQQQLVMALWR